MPKEKSKTNKSSENLRLEYEKLLVFHDSLESEIKELNRSLNNNADTNVNIPNIESEKPDPKLFTVNHEKSLEELLNCLRFSEAINKLKFSNEQIEYLPTDENDTDIKFKKLYRADCVVCEKTKFQFELIINENMKNVEVIQSINLNFEDLRESTEMSSGLSILKKVKNVHFLFSAIRQYSILSKQREDIINTLPEKFFLFEINEEDGKYIIKCFSKNRKYFTLEWSIYWNSYLYNFMQGFEITIEYDDDEFCKIVQPIFDSLCETVDSVEDAKNKVLQWRNDIVNVMNEFDHDV